MTEGLITRIGKWIDRKWDSKATEKDLQDHDAECRGRYVAMCKETQDLRERIVKAEAPRDQDKELAELKTRIEKIELYAGMTRKVDPTKPPIVKSAFAM